MGCVVMGVKIKLWKIRRCFRCRCPCMKRCYDGCFTTKKSCLLMVINLPQQSCCVSWMAVHMCLEVSSTTNLYPKNMLERIRQDDQMENKCWVSFDLKKILKRPSKMFNFTSMDQTCHLLASQGGKREGKSFWEHLSRVGKVFSFYSRVALLFLPSLTSFGWDPFEMSSFSLKSA